MAENCQKKYQKMGKITIKGPKMAKNGPKLSKVFRKMVQMRPVIPTPNYLTLNGIKLLKNYPKMAIMTLKWPKMA